MDTTCERINILREELAKTSCDSFFNISPPLNQYLSGFITSFIEISSAIIITSENAIFLCDSRYAEQAYEQVNGFSVEQIEGNLTEKAGQYLNNLGATRVAYEPEALTVQEFNEINEVINGSLESSQHIASQLRKVKSDNEIELIRSASELAEGVLSDLVENLVPGITERELAARFEYEFKKRGAFGASFDTIALFGKRTSLVHGLPGDNVLEEGDIILLDFGCRCAGYCSDLTRTFIYGTIPDKWFSEIYALVLSAQQAALEAVRPGIRCQELDSIARDIIIGAGYGDYFGHGLGHGVGIEIHELPRISRFSDDVLEPGMTITVEPGIYVPGRGGVRIEDLVAVTENGCDILSNTPKKLRILGK